MCADHATVIHPFVSAIADLSGSLVKPSDWNHGHTFQGGIDGDLLTKDASQTDGVLFKSVLSHILGRLLNVQVGNDSQNNSASPTIDMVNLTFTAQKSNSTILIVSQATLTDASGTYHSGSLLTYLDNNLIVNNPIIALGTNHVFITFHNNLSIGSHTVKGHFTTPNPNMNVTLNYLTLEWG